MDTEYTTSPQNHFRFCIQYERGIFSNEGEQWKRHLNLGEIRAVTFKSI